MGALILACCAGACATHQAPTIQPPRLTPGLAVARSAEALIGAPYRDGGSGPHSFDCSGLVAFVYARQGVAAPRSVREQWRVGRTIPRDAIQPGDLLFFQTTGTGASHVAIALDTRRFVHAPKQGGRVRVESLASSYWSGRFLGARRYGP